jgi:hypothetical protein
MISSQWTAQLAAVVPEIKPLHIEASALLQGFPNIRVSWVPRKWNAGGGRPPPRHVLVDSALVRRRI